jgi:hypothetical protein
VAAVEQDDRLDALGGERRRTQDDGAAPGVTHQRQPLDAERVRDGEGEPCERTGLVARGRQRRRLAVARSVDADDTPAVRDDRGRRLCEGGGGADGPERVPEEHRRLRRLPPLADVDDVLADLHAGHRKTLLRNLHVSYRDRA